MKTWTRHETAERGECGCAGADDGVGAGAAARAGSAAEAAAGGIVRKGAPASASASGPVARMPTRRLMAQLIGLVLILNVVVFTADSH